MLRIYLAAAWSRCEEIGKIADELDQIAPGRFQVAARWLDEAYTQVPKNLSFLRERARMDVEDVRAADILIRFSDDLSVPYVPARLASGARMFEMGLAYALGKTIVVVGGYQPIFDYLPTIAHVSDVPALKRYLLDYLNTTWTGDPRCTI